MRTQMTFNNSTTNLCIALTAVR